MRCTGASSKWGNIFDHGIDLVHPPFWWWAWEHGLAAYGRPLSPLMATMVLWAIVGGYVAQRVIEGIFMRRFGKGICLFDKVSALRRHAIARAGEQLGDAGYGAFDHISFHNFSTGM